MFFATAVITNREASDVSHDALGDDVFIFSNICK